jgi:DNA-directed RNA polymerase subunit RPC12/RpoP
MSDERKFYNISGYKCSSCKNIINARIEVGLNQETFLCCNHCGHQVGTIKLKEFK